MNHKNIAEWLIDWFAEHTAQTTAEIETRMDDNYFEIGLIDSFTFIELIANLEDTFGLEFDNEAFEDRSFASIRGLAKIAQDLTAGQ